ncbi:MAG: twin-arginine translocase TatA/TatE family subunit [Pseudomonadota bacterium]
MSFAGISGWQLLIILVIVIAIFGTKKFKNIGGDVGSAIKGFKTAMGDGEAKADEAKAIDEREDATFESTPSKESSKTGQS